MDIFNFAKCILLYLNLKWIQVLYKLIKLMQKPQAVGSLWNVNSWHWQMKNYTKPAQQILEAKILSLQLQVSPQLKIKHKKVKFSKGECQINVRKGKQILVYDYELDIDIVGEQQNGQKSQGSYKVREILSDDLNDMVIEDVKATEKNKTAQLIKKWIKKNIKAKIIQVFQHLEEELVKKESDPTKIQEDKKKRQQSQVATQKAREEKGAQKQRLLQQQRQKQKRLKEQAMYRNYEQALKKTEK